MTGVRVLIGIVLGLLLAPSAWAQAPGCVGETDAASVEQRPGPLMRFGITPGVQTGQFFTGPAEPRTPEDPVRHLEALGRLRPPQGDFVLRLHRFFWSEGEPAVQRFLALADRYTAAGYKVELQLRYHPSAEQEGDIAAWVAHVRDVVRRFGTNPGVVAIQVTNEVNITFSPDSSDGSYDGARDALVQGVIAASDEARRIGSKVEIGFNWAYRVDPAQDTSFWNGVRDRGGKPFVDALDWVGVDAYPGTVFPPAHTPGGERDGIVNALSSARCFMAIPGIPETVPIHIEENGWPTSPVRSEAQQLEVMNTMVRAVHDFRGTFNVSDYRWFNLRDGDSTSPNFGVRYGLLRDDYSEKPAFAGYAALVRELAAPAPTAAVRTARRTRLRLRIACGRAVVMGAGIRSVDFRHGRRLIRKVTRPFVLRFPRGRTVRATIRLRDGRHVRLVRHARCRKGSDPLSRGDLDLVDGPAGFDGGRVVGDRVAGWVGVVVAALDEQPLAAAGTGERPAAGELLPLHRE
jgi:hypothetical protein